MLKYGNIQINYKPGTLSIAKSKDMIIRHYIGTKRSSKSDLGIRATEISCTAVTQTATEYLVLQQLLDSTEERNLQVYDLFFKSVVTGPNSTLKPETPDGGVWEGQISFIVLNPVPYDIETGEALY